MSMKRVFVQVGEDGTFANDKQLKVSQALCKLLRLQDGDSVSLKFGQQIDKVSIKEVPTNKSPVIEISPSLAKILYIPFEILPIHCLYKQEENTLKLGPIITCVTNQLYQEEQKFGNLTGFFEELISLSRRNHILFYISPISTWEDEFHGYYFEDQRWHDSTMPLPNAIYNRIGSRNFENSEIWENFAFFLENNDIPYFNHSFLDKWEIHQVLSTFPEVIPYLPFTAIFDDYDLFIELLTSHNCIYMKPVNGSQGRQILRIEVEDDHYIVYYSSYSQEVSTIFKSSYLLYKRLKERLKNQTFIIQKGLDLIHLEERPLDFRILCVKDSENQWKVISTVARLSPKKRMVSNLAQGGEQKKPLDVLTALYEEKVARQYLKLMNELAIETAALISESYEGIFAELGIDVALDEKGHLWIIEVNSKPSKAEEETDRIRPSTRAIVSYLSHLAGFSLPNKPNKNKER